MVERVGGVGRRLGGWGCCEWQEAMGGAGYRGERVEESERGCFWARRDGGGRRAGRQVHGECCARFSRRSYDANFASLSAPSLATAQALASSRRSRVVRSWKSVTLAQTSQARPPTVPNIYDRRVWRRSTVAGGSSGRVSRGSTGSRQSPQEGHRKLATRQYRPGNIDYSSRQRYSKSRTSRRLDPFQVPYRTRIALSTL